MIAKFTNFDKDTFGEDSIWENQSEYFETNDIEEVISLYHRNEQYKRVIDESIPNSYEIISKVTYIFGVLQNSLNETAKKLDWEDIVMECKNIAIDWMNEHDIKDTEEEGYVMKYAERVLTERYGE